MFLEICLAILTLTFIILIFVLLRISSQAQHSIYLLQTDIRSLSTQMILLLEIIKEFVQKDLHAISDKSCQLITQLNDLSSDINQKSHSLNFLFKPLSFLSSKLGEDLPSRESTSKNETIPQILKWVGSGVLLFKTIKEVIKNHEKRK